MQAHVHTDAGMHACTYNAHASTCTHCTCAPDIRCAHAASLDVGGDRSEHRRRKCKVKQTISCALVLHIQQFLVEVLEGSDVIVGALDILVDLPEFFDLGSFIILNLNRN